MQAAGVTLSTHFEKNNASPADLTLSSDDEVLAVTL
jgi:hypothetical protein